MPSKYSAFTESNLFKSLIDAQYSMRSVKDVVMQKDSLWKNFFKDHVKGNQTPNFSIFRKNINFRDSGIEVPEGTDLHLQLLLLKSDGEKYPRNPNALGLERQLNTYFFGPLILCFDVNYPNTKLLPFPLKYVKDKIEKLNT